MLFWASEARWSRLKQHELVLENAVRSNVATEDALTALADDPSISSVSASLQKLDSLKADLASQYAQFGHDQSRLNGRGLGTWHPVNKPCGDADDSGNSEE